MQLQYMCDKNVNKVAMFLGSVPGSSRNGNHVDNVLNEETVGNLADRGGDSTVQ